MGLRRLLLYALRGNEDGIDIILWLIHLHHSLPQSTLLHLGYSSYLSPK
ncbi:hypothetical protein HMPREF9134_01675 [Porphyromonas catoniae F0037]|uniref:Uncharacterized protein n=1 Tax=Porphyromonas catoniae F0037 TaxID=1127696 RepID=L1NAJ5_9PORP|nr:hypothetical protein HMPREF9134_01675 [Porphyromonas catoniae F0037]